MGSSTRAASSDRAPLRLAAPAPAGAHLAFRLTGLGLQCIDESTTDPTPVSGEGRIGVRRWTLAAAGR